jgi:general secretion pathway protein B
MSYILEALRKSEQERNPTEVPSLKTHHPMIHKEQKSKAVYWIFGIVLLLINGFLLGYIIFGNKDDSEANNEELATLSTSKSAQNKATGSENYNIENANVETLASQEEFVEVQPIITPPVKEVIAKSLSGQNIQQDATQEDVIKTQQVEDPKVAITELDRGAVPDIFDLEYAFQQKIPDMEFSTHIYVSGGGSFVIINGQSLSDGMSVERGLVLVNILADGVILRFKGRRFFLDSMTNWQRD